MSIEIINGVCIMNMRINEELMKQHKSMKIMSIKRNHNLGENILKVYDKEFRA